MATPPLSPLPARLLPLLLVVAMVTPMAVCSLGRDDTEVRDKREATRIVRVVSVLHPPYVMWVEGSTIGRTVYNDSGVLYTGFIPDMMDSIAQRLHLEIQFYIEPEGRWGSFDSNHGTWNGMIGEVIKRKANKPGVGADIAAAALTMTSSREKYVDFLKGFQHHGIVMLIKKPATDQNTRGKAFNILTPLAPEIWIFSSLAVIIVGLILWANNRLNPYEYGCRSGLGQASEEAAELFNMQGSLWFAFTTLQWQGFERAPRSLSSRLLTCFWFVFVTLTLVTYTGSLMSHLFWISTVNGSRFVPDVTSVEDLVRSKDYDYGFIKGGSTERYFMQIASGEVFDKMRLYLAKKGDSVLEKSTDGGVARVRQGGYVFFMEKYSAEFYANQQPCDVMITGAMLGHRAYGFAIPHSMDPSLREDLHAAVLEMMEEGDIDALEKKWWYMNGECQMSPSESTLSESQSQSRSHVNEPMPVSLAMFRAPFLLLMVGIFLAIILSLAEIVFYKYRGQYKPSNRLRDARLATDEEDCS